MTNKEGRKSKLRSLKWKLLFSLAVFTVVVLVVVWVFQILLLGRFYESAKLRELDRAADDLSESLTDPRADLGVEAAVYAEEYQMYVRIFCHEFGAMEEIAAAHLTGDYYIRNISSENIDRLYSMAKAEKNGTYAERRTVKPWMPDGDEGTVVTADEKKEIVFVRIVHSGGSEYVVMLNMIYTPLNATVSTLNNQFVWICGIVIFGTLIFAAILSKTIVEPITRVNAQAKKLGEGNFDIELEKDMGYLEITELSETLDYAASELSRTENLRRELMANISHDLRTPLTMISGYGEVMRDIPGENTPENIQVIIDESTHLSELVSDLLDLSKIQSGNVRYSFDVFDLTAAVGQAMDRYKKFKVHEGYSIEFLSSEHVNVKADRVRMLQVVYNLINNAINYSGDVKEIRVEQTLRNGCVRIAVSDRGEGIAPENLPDIWDRYYKVDRVHRRATVGTGLGLSIVKGLLEGHNARYGVESALGYGSTFWFELPVEETKETE